MQKKTLFNNVIYKGIMGSIFGIVAGLLLGLLIFGLEEITVIIYGYINSPAQNNFGPPIAVFIVLGMGFGAVIGSIFGGLTAYKEGLKD
jgi:hypothetical protein